MKKNDWDEEWKFEKKIRKLIMANANPPHKFPRVGHRLDESQVVSVARAFITFLAKDRIHREAKILKRLPSARTIRIRMKNKMEGSEDIHPIALRKSSEAIRDLIKEKLEGRNDAERN